MKLDKLPKIGEGLWVDGKLCRIADIKTIIDEKKATIQVDIIGKFEMLSMPIEIEFKAI